MNQGQAFLNHKKNTTGLPSGWSSANTQFLSKVSEKHFPISNSSHLDLILSSITDSKTTSLFTRKLNADISYIYHIKGNQRAYYRDHHKKIRYIEVADFLKIFNSLRKNKQEQVQLSSPQFKALSLSGHGYFHFTSNASVKSIIFIHRNDLFSFSDDELNRFKTLRFFLHFKFNLDIIKHTLDQEKKIDLHISDFFLQLKDDCQASQLVSLYHHHKFGILNELLNTLNHELKNPLFGIRLSLELLKTLSSGDDQAFLDQMLNNVEKCNDIFRNFGKSFSKERKSLKRDPLTILEDVLSLLKSSLKGIKVKVEICDQCKNKNLKIKSFEISQILTNLILNSAQSLQQTNQAGKILIKITSNDQKSISFQVYDNGPGILSNSHKDIFKSFYTTKSEGTGIGLTICNEMAKSVGGTFYLKKSNHEETIFTCDIPYENLIN